MEAVVREREPVSRQEEGIVKTVNGRQAAAGRKRRHDGSIERGNGTRVHQELRLRETVRNEPICPAKPWKSR